MIDGSIGDSTNEDSNDEANTSSSSSAALSSKEKANTKKNGAPTKKAAASSPATSSDASDKELYNGMSKDKYTSFRPQLPERSKGPAMEVVVDHGVERAIKVLKRKLIREGLFKELKSRRYHSKPSEEKKRRLKESLKKIRKEEARRQKSQLLF